MKISVIVPCYNSSGTIQELVELSIEELEKLPVDSYEFVLVNDFSKNKETIETLIGLSERYPFVKVLDLAKNFGQANAQLAALNYATGDYIINMDDDMQTHPKNIPILFNKIQEGYDLVLAKYKQKKHRFYRRLLTKMGDRFDELCLDRPRHMQFTSFWICRKYVRNELIRYHYPYSYMEGLFLRTTRNIANVEVEHFARTVGASGYNLKKLVRLWSNFTNFTVLPLRIAGVAGGIFAGAGLILSLIFIIRAGCFGFLPADCFMSIVGLLLLFFGITLIAIGIMGEYVGRSFLCINQSPQYVVRQTYNVENKEGED